VVTELRQESFDDEDKFSSEVLILMATYNGAPYIEEQIESIQNQTETSWVLLVRDDGSTDRTMEIVETLASDDGRIKILRDDKGRLGATGNFGALMESPVTREAKYIMFADQDDVWRQEKIALMLHHIKHLEDEHGADCSLLVHSDLEVVDAELRTIHGSYLRYQMIGHEEKDPLKVLLTHNFATGCACILNNKLAELAIPFPPQVRLHDHWVALLASANGKIGFISEPTIKYRQHGKNEIGAKSYWKEFTPRYDVRKRWKQHLGKFISSMQVAQLLRDRLIERDSFNNHEILGLIDRYVSVIRLSRLERIREFRRFGIRRQGLLRQLLLYGCLLSSKVERLK
jgi:glycosyltransferase involved in cell wall biosynthesis